jgi:ribonuclease HIII
MNFYSVKLPLTEAENLKSKLNSDGFTFTSQTNALWRADGEGVCIIYYKSSKCLVQGKNTDNFAKKYFNIVEQPSIITTETFVHDFPAWIGTDESGKGDYFGPLVAAGVMVKREQVEYLTSLNIKDSKKLTDSFIRKISNEIKKNCPFSIVVISDEKYNELYAKFGNLNKLLAWAHAKAIENILGKNSCDYAISDKFGDESLIKNALQKEGKKIELIQRTKAESDIAVACASVIARCEYVERMEKLGFEFKLDLKKGASEQVTSIAQDFVQKYGKERLKFVAKLHFKNTSLLKF